MFAVPGWSVSASTLKRQTEADIARAESQAGKESKKRKRKSNASTTVTDENVSNLWAQRFEGKKPAPVVKAPIKESDAATVQKGSTAGVEQTSSGKGQNGAKQDTTHSDTSKGNDKKSAKKNKAAQKQNGTSEKSSLTTTKASAPTPPAVPALPTTAKLTPLQQKMREKLVSARFRHLNETLYTAPSATSQTMFADNPSMFDDYHSGFRRQVSVWPENPVDTFTRAIEVRAKVRPQSRRKAKSGNAISAANGGPADEGPEMLPRNKAGLCTIADLGCGDAALAGKLTASGTAGRRGLRILSYDLGKANELVTKADVANLPLADGSVDVAIFCLALMGTNWIDFVEEAYRVLRWKGELWVAEIKSRFARAKEQKSAVVEHSVGKRRKVMEKKGKEEEEVEDAALRTEVDGEERREDTQVQAFVQVLARRGFVLRKGEQSVDVGNKMFVRMEFVKGAPAAVGKNVREEASGGAGGGGGGGGGKKKFVEAKEQGPTREQEGAVLKPCLYKVR